MWVEQLRVAIMHHVHITLDPHTGQVVVAYDQSMEEFVEAFPSIERFREVRFPAAKSIDLQMYAQREYNDNRQQEVPQIPSLVSEGAGQNAEVYRKKYIPRAVPVDTQRGVQQNQRSAREQDHKIALARDVMGQYSRTEMVFLCTALIKVWIPNKNTRYPYSYRGTIRALPPQWPVGVPYAPPCALGREHLANLALTIIAKLTSAQLQRALRSDEHVTSLELALKILAVLE